MSLTHLARSRSVLLTASLAVALVAAGVVTSGAANAVTPPAGSLAGIMLETGGFSGDPTNAITTGWWGHEGAANDTGTGETVLSVDASDGAGMVNSTTLAAFLAKMGTDKLNKIAYAIVPYSANGSTEMPTVTAGENAASVFANDCTGPVATPCSTTSAPTGWLVDDSAPSVSIKTTTAVNDGLSAFASTRSQITRWVAKAEPVQGYNSTLHLLDVNSPGSPISPTPKGTSFLNTWPAGTHLSLVAYVTNGNDTSVDNKVPLVASTGGKAQTAWLNFTTVAKPGDSLRTSAGYVVDGAYAPTVTLASSFSGSTATLTGTVKNAANATATDATGNLEFAPYIGGVDQTPVTVAVTNGVASTQISVPAGTTKTYDVRYVPDVAAQGTYLTSEYIRKTLIGPIATATTLGVVGGPTDTLTATANPHVAGKVVFKDGSTVIGTVAVNSAGAATLVHKLTPAQHLIGATFTPTSSSYTASAASKTVYQTKITATLSPKTGKHGGRPTATIRVTTTGATVSGKVVVTWKPPTGAAHRYTITLRGGVAKLVVPKTIKGTSTLTVSYAASGVFLTAPSTATKFKAT
jgi:hypothetical protein